MHRVIANETRQSRKKENISSASCHCERSVAISLKKKIFFSRDFVNYTLKKPVFLPAAK
jgi:hypothetical protein